MLLLTLERSGVRHPAVYMSAARRAQQLSSLDNRRLFLALGQFQGALALIARMASVHTLDVAATESLVTSLASVPPNHDGRYGGAIATWMQQQLRPALAVRLKPDAAGDLHGPAKPDSTWKRSSSRPWRACTGQRPDAASTVEWEGDVYRVDIAASEERRLRRIREKQGGPSIDEALARGKEDALADVLDGVDLCGVDCRRRQPGAADRRRSRAATISVWAPGEHGLRLRTAWALPRQDIAVGVPWHVTGSLLGLDIALSGCRCGASAATARSTRRRSRPTSATRLRSRWRC